MTIGNLIQIAQVKLNDLDIPRTEADSSSFQSITSLVFVIIGGLSIIFIVVGGLQYVLSGGDPQNTQKAKNTILYSIIGLILSLLAFVIVSVVAETLS